MKPSAELRWFFRQHLPEEVKEWFCSGKLCKKETTRTDQYLLFPGSNEVGVKVRDGRKLEIKARTRPPRPFRLSDGTVVGRQDDWVKWTHEDSQIAGRLVALSGNAPHWVKVVKRRLLREFRIDPTAGVVETDPNADDEDRCRVELSEIEIRGSYWWTLAFDAFGDTDRAAELEQVARHFLKILPNGLVLRELDSMAYPEWLGRISD